MKLFGALAFMSAVAANPFAPKSEDGPRAELIRKLVSAATATANSQIRQLDQAYQVDISGYYVKFEQCQFVKTYDSQMAEYGSDTVLSTKRFVLFRLCPGDCASCNYNYGEYLVDLETYLTYTVQFFQDYQDNMCTYCASDCTTDDAGASNNVYGSNCDECTVECEKIQYMNDNGYIDATTFIGCEMIYDVQDDQKATLYGGPICANAGSKIKIGVFTDENCMYIDSTKDVDDYLQGNNGQQMKLSHALLKFTYTDTCIACAESGNDDKNDADSVSEMCEALYTNAAKCETAHGFTNGYSGYSGYENQLSNEQVVCDYLQSLKSGTYDESGEIVASGVSSVKSGKATTGGQKFALTFFMLGTVALAVYAAMLHAKLVKGKDDLSGSGGAMA